jgi:hypothetical protein
MQDMYTGMTKQIIDFNRNTFDGGFKAMTMLQDQTEKTFYSMLDQASWMPEDSKKMLNEWLNNCKKGRDEFKKMIDEGFNKFEELTMSSMKNMASQ